MCCGLPLIRWRGEGCFACMKEVKLRRALKRQLVCLFIFLGGNLPITNAGPLEDLQGISDLTFEECMHVMGEYDMNFPEAKGACQQMLRNIKQNCQNDPGRPECGGLPPPASTFETPGFNSPRSGRRMGQDPGPSRRELYRERDARSQEIARDCVSINMSKVSRVTGTTFQLANACRNTVSVKVCVFPKSGGKVDKTARLSGGARSSFLQFGNVREGESRWGYFACMGRCRNPSCSQMQE